MIPRSLARLTAVLVAVPVGVWRRRGRSGGGGRRGGPARRPMSGGRSGFSGRPPSAAAAAALEATSTAGSPLRRGAISTGIGWPVTARHASTTSRTEKPLPLPRL